MPDLLRKTCRPCAAGTPALTREQTTALLPQVPDWSTNATASELARVFTFKNFYETMAFVNAVAFIAHREDHHPDMEVSYNRCHIRLSTHSIKGLSENDFICAAKIGALVAA